MSTRYAHCEMPGCENPLAVRIPVPKIRVRDETGRWVCLVCFSEYQSAVERTVERLAHVARQRKGR